MGSTIFVGGVHGAGKTTVSEELSQLLGASHVTAGGLIRESALAGATITVGLKAVPDVCANQLLLLRGLAHYRSRVSGTILLDGHFVLLDPAGGIAEIPVAVYEAIAPVSVLLVETDAETIHSRLIRRDGEAPPVTTIVELARRERAHAEKVCEHLKIPLWALAGDWPPEEEFVIRVKALLGGAA